VGGIELCAFLNTIVQYFRWRKGTRTTFHEGMSGPYSLPAAILLYLLILQAGATCAAEPPTNPASSEDTVSTADTAREPSSEAWWTGPLVASPAMTLPRGEFYVEPYLYNSVPYGSFDTQGRLHAVPRQNELGSMTYLKYGVSDRLTVGLTPLFGYDWVDQGESSSGLGVGDPSVQVQYRLTPDRPDSEVPTVSVDLQESLPVGRYDRLGRSTDGFGSGAYVTTFSTYLQSLFRMPNGRPLRVRLNLSYGVSNRVSIVGASVYGTPRSFRGGAQPGDSESVDIALEYSATRNWVLAVDFWQQGQRSTCLAGSYSHPGGGTLAFSSISDPVRSLIVAPALEYNWSSRLGIIFGVQVVADGHNTIAAVTPVAALSYML
jgi:hypothetical protein